MRKAVFLSFIVISCLLMGCGKQMQPGSTKDIVSETTEPADSLAGATIWTEPEIYIYSAECGYVGEWGDIREEVVMIEDRVQWDAIWDSCEILHENGQTEKYIAGLGNLLSKICDPKEYPLDQYTYFYFYETVSSGGYSYHADKLILKDDMIFFGKDEKSHGPQTDYVTDVMGGFFYFAAVPKEMIGERSFSNVITLSAEAFVEEQLQSGNAYGWHYADNVAGEDLMEVYGEALYLIRSQEEYEVFLAKADGTEIKRKDVFDKEIPFDSTILACTFLETEKEKTDLFFQYNGYKVLRDGRIRLQYWIDEEPKAERAKGTSMYYLLIPRTVYEQELEEARAVQSEEQQETTAEAVITYQDFTEKDGSFALVLGVLDQNGEELEVTLPTNLSNAVMGAAWIREDLLGIETHVNPSVSEYYLYDTAAGEVQRSYAGCSFAVIPGTDHIMYEDHFSKSFYIDDQEAFTTSWENYQLGTPVFSNDLRQVAFWETYRENAGTEEEGSHLPHLYICDLHLTDLTVKSKAMTVLEKEYPEISFNEDGELMIETDDETFVYCGGLTRFRQ